MVVGSQISASEVTSEQLQSFREAAKLNVQVAQLLSEQRRHLDQPNVQYCKATALILKELLKRTENLQERQEVGESFKASCGDREAGETAASVPTRLPKLRREVVLDEGTGLVANPLVRLLFEDAENKVYETGVNIANRGCLILPKTVQLGEEWTISVWTLAPIDVGDHTYRDLVDAPNSQELIAVILARGRLGSLGPVTLETFPPGFNARDLSPGWHHICVVASGRCTTYYVDGHSLGVKRGRARGTIGVVGNSRTCREAWGYMSDFAIFGVSADAQQVKGLYEAGAPLTLHCETEEPWQAAIARQNAEFSDSLSEFGSGSDFSD
eukprot:s144_g11.t1